ncbi:MAG: P22 coat - protein 5 family protein [Comamonadaceae bacterium]|nr:MAG: P22 coat - protein 5 family protein [Comamonadaceae bacterium]
MSNVLTSLAADIYKAADVVGRELVGIIPSVTINGDASTRAAKGDVVRSHFTRTPAVSSSFAPAMTIPEGTDQTVDNRTLTVDTYASVQIPWTGEDVKHVNNGSGFETIYGDQIKQAMRAIANTIEAYLFGVAYKASSRAVGTAGTTPFATTFDTIALVRQILVDNGAPANDGLTSLVMNSAAGAKLRNLAQLQKANEAGSTVLLRQGTLLDLQGLMMKESAGITSHAKGAGTGYDANQGAGFVVGDTSIILDGGTVNVTGIKSGDVVTFAGDANNYVVATGTTATGATIVLNDPGLRATLADAVEMTIGNSYTPNLAFHKSAIELVVRPPAMPNGGDAAVDLMTVQDPWSGLVFEVAMYKGYMKSMVEVRCIYGAKAWKPNHIATLMG